MMTTAKSGKKTIGIWAIVCTLVISVGFMVALIPTQEAFAEKKKITGTSTGIDLLSRGRIPVPKSPVKGYISAKHQVLDSADSDWNKADYFFVVYAASTREWNNKGYGVITHPSGDKTYIEFEEKYGASGSIYKGEVEGFFLKGTGKFKGIKGSWSSNWKRDPERVEEWQVEYEIK